MFGPLLVSSVFVLAVIILCIRKPNAGRIFLGFFFLAMAIGVNGSITVSNPQLFVEYGQNALLPLYQTLTMKIITLNPVLFGILLITFELISGILILQKGILVKIGLAGTIIFVIAISPVSIIQFPWLGLVIAKIFLFTKHFEHSLWDIIKKKLAK